MFNILKKLFCSWGLLKEDAKDDDDQVTKQGGKGDEDLLNHAEASGWKTGRNPAQDNFILCIKPFKDIFEKITATVVPMIVAEITIDILD